MKGVAFPKISLVVIDSNDRTKVRRVKEKVNKTAYTYFFL